MWGNDLITRFCNTRIGCDKSNGEILEMIDNLNFYVGKSIHHLPFARVVGIGIYHLNLKVRKMIHNLYFEVGKSLNNLHTPAKTDTAEVAIGCYAVVALHGEQEEGGE